MIRGLVVGLLLLAFESAAGAKNLLQVYEDALQNDPQIREADATRLAAREARPQAWSLLLPQLNASASTARSKSDSTRPSLQPVDPSNPDLGTNTESDGEINSYRVELRQSLFSWSDWMTLRRSSKEVAQAEADYRTAEQDLIQRVSQRYFDVLAAQDTVEANQAAFDAISRQLEQAEKRFEVGLIAITDVQDAKAARDNASAAVISAKRQLTSAIESLRAITSQQYDVLAKPGQSMPLRSPEPADAERWVEISMQQNLALISSRLQADIARDNVSIARGGHFPTIDIVGTRNDSDGKLDLTSGPVSVDDADSLQTDDSVSLQVTLPIFSGGRTQSQVRQSQYRWIAAKERMSRVSRETERLARDAYLGVLSEMARVSALRQALESSQTALKATEAGYEVGTRTAVDVLASRQTLVQAQTDYARSRYDYILNVLNLQLAAGTLDRKMLEEINTWLTETAPASTPSPQAPTPPPAQQPPPPPAR